MSPDGGGGILPLGWGEPDLDRGITMTARLWAVEKIVGRDFSFAQHPPYRGL